MEIGSRLGSAGLAVAVGLALAVVALMASSYTIQASDTGICGRTQQVQDVILGKLAEGSACADVTDSDLASITEIIILDQDTLTLQDGDFAGLSKLDSLYIHKNGLSELPGDLFDGLTTLTELYLYNNELTTLPSDLFDGLSALETLSLSYNSLDELPSDVFDGLSGLKTLELDNNDLDELPVGLFEELSGLEKLVLTSNSLEEVSGGDFEDLVNLKDLRLGGNDLGEVPADLLEALTKLETLHLYSAGLTGLPDGLFDGLSSLQNLILHSNPGSPFTLKAVVGDWEDGGVVIEVPEATPFELEVTLTAEGGTLSASTVSISGGDQESEKIAVTPATADGDVTVTVGSATFKDGKYEGIQAGVGEPVTVSFPGICGRTQEVQDAILATLPNVSKCADVTATHLASITYLGAGNKDIASLKEGDFGGLSALRELWLSDNDLTTLPEELFDGLSNLEELFLQRNEITALPEEVFAGLGSLTRLHIEQNDIDTLPEDIFDGLANLQKLYMQSNGLTGLPEDVFDGLSSLEEVDMSYNKFATLPEELFDGLSNLRELDAESNLITSLPEDVFDGLGSLESLYLEQQNFFNPDATLVLTEDLFDGLNSLTTLILKNANLQSLPEDIFDGLDDLETLNLEENALSALPEDVFDGLNSLMLLNLYNNRIGSLPADVFDGLGELQTLNLRYNQISELPDELFSGLSSLEVLYLGNNPGTSFTFTAELEQRGDNGVVIKVAEGAPFNMAVTLNFRAGSLSSNLAVPISGGDLASGVVTSPVSDDDGVTVKVVAAVFLEGTREGIQTGLGESLTLSSSSTDGDGENTPAAGVPTISGTPQVGQTLTASTSGISDANGLDNVSYRYQWLANDSEISDATNSIYTIQSSDNGKAIKVRVTFEDDAGHNESLTSEGTSEVALGGL